MSNEPAGNTRRVDGGAGCGVWGGPNVLGLTEGLRYSASSKVANGIWYFRNAAGINANFSMKSKMTVVINGEETNWTAVLIGVPQGSVLGSLLFLIYVNELPDIIESSVRMFADDTKPWRKIQNEEDEQILQQDLDRLENWSETWLLKFNASKCKVMQIGRKRNVNYHLRSGMDIVNLTETEMEKDLGVWIDKDLKWSHQCRKAASKAMSVLGMIKRSFKHIDVESFKILYNTYIRPHLEYCVQVWNPYHKNDIECLEKVQRRATKLIRALAKTPYEERLQKLGLFTLERRRMRGDLIEPYKILHGLENVDEHTFFKKTTGNLRGHSLKLYHKPVRLGVRKFFFSQRIVDNWNRLPEEAVSAWSLSTFKKKLDNWMDRNRH